MGGSFIKIEGLDKALERLDVKKYQNQIESAFYKFGVRVEENAKQLAPVNEGLLKNSIEREGTPLSATIYARANYAAFVEFGTRKFAAEYVNTLPLEWQQLAERAKGQGSGSFDDLVIRLVEWVKKKGLHLLSPIHDAQTGQAYYVKKRKSAAKKAEDADKIAYLIARKILREGVPEQPFLYPAFNNHKDQLLKDLENIKV